MKMSDIDKDKARRPSFMVKQDEKTKSGKEKKKNHLRNSVRLYSLNLKNKPSPFHDHH